MVQHHSVKVFFRQMPNALLAQYFFTAQTGDTP
jgi:hypothetical protein